MRSHRRRSWSAAVLAAACCLGTSGESAHRATADEQAAPAPRLTPAQLKELVGPIALYPDAVLASLLPATTFPLDVIGAARWLESKNGVAEQVPENSGWDASVQALVQFPDLLKWLNENLEWMDQMGSAVASQQPEVLQAIQDFRRESKDAGNLASGEHIVVKEEPAPEAPAGTTVIVIQPANPQIVYLPTYDPIVVTRPYYGPPRPSLLDYSMRFAVGALGVWAWHEIGWGWWDSHHYHGWHGGIYHHHDVHYWSQPRPPGWWAGPNRPDTWRPPTNYRPRPVPYADRPMVRPSRPQTYYRDPRPEATRPVVQPPKRKPGTSTRPWTPSPVTPNPDAPTYPKPKPGGSYDPGAGKWSKPYPTNPQPPVSRPPTSVPAKGKDPWGHRGRESLNPVPPPKKSKPAPYTPTVPPQPKPTPTVPKARPKQPAPPSTPISRAPAPQAKDWSKRGKQSKQPPPAPPPPPKKKKR